MSRLAKIALIIAGVLIVIGVALVIVGFVNGGSLQDAVNQSYVSTGSLSMMTDRGDDIAWEKTDESHKPDPVESEIRSIHVDWIGGAVYMEVTDGEELIVSETSEEVISEEFRMLQGLRGTEYHIVYCEDQMIIGRIPNKTLTVSIPKSMLEQLDTINIGSTSANLFVTDVTADRMVFDMVSGDLRAKDVAAQHVFMSSTSGDMDFYGFAASVKADSTSGNIKVHQLGTMCAAEADTVSGDVELTGVYTEVSVDTTSGNVTLAPSVYVTELEVETTSGDVELILESFTDASIEYETASGEFQSDLPTKRQGDEYILNTGAAEYEISTSSGDLTITEDIPVFQ